MSERVYGSGDSGERASCRQCGALVALDRDAMALIHKLSEVLVSRGERPLERQEVVVCDRDRCRDAEVARLDREQRQQEQEVDSLIRRVRAGEAIRIPAGWSQRRPGDFDRVVAAMRALREGEE